MVVFGTMLGQDGIMIHGKESTLKFLMFKMPDYQQKKQKAKKHLNEVFLLPTKHVFVGLWNRKSF